MYETIILAAAKAANVSGPLLLAICMHESGLSNINVPLDGGSTSYGLCQLKENTASLFGFDNESENLNNPKTNAKYAALYLKYQLNRYDGSWVMATAAYNSGTYNPSNRALGCPRNLKYLRNVQRKLEKELQPRMHCGVSK